MSMFKLHNFILIQSYQILVKLILYRSQSFLIVLFQMLPGWNLEFSFEAFYMDVIRTGKSARERVENHWNFQWWAKVKAYCRILASKDIHFYTERGEKEEKGKKESGEVVEENIPGFSVLYT